MQILLLDTANSYPVILMIEWSLCRWIKTP